jgi:hypothetical protein
MDALHLFISNTEKMVRREVLEPLTAFIPVIGRLDKDVGLHEIRRAILDTGKWFP